MLNIRNLALAVSLSVGLLLTVGLVNARTEVASTASSDANSVSAIQEQSAIARDHYREYRSQFGECYDVSIRELAACSAAIQSSTQSERLPLDECYDVSVSELAICREADQAAIP